MSWDPPPGGGGYGPPPATPPYGQPPGGPAFGPPPPGPGFYHGPGAGKTPHRGAIILILSIMSFFVMLFGCSMCGPMGLLSLAMSVPAIVMGKADLAAMEAGTMDPSGRDITNIGWIIGIVSTVFSALLGLVMIAVVILYGGLFGAAMLNQPNQF